MKFIVLIYRISRCGQPTLGGPPGWGLGEGLTTPHPKNPVCYEELHRASEFASLCGHGNEPSGYISQGIS